MGRNEGGRLAETARARFLRSASLSIVLQVNFGSESLRLAQITSEKNFGIFGASFAPRVETMTFVPPPSWSTSFSVGAVSLKKKMQSEDTLIRRWSMTFIATPHSP